MHFEKKKKRETERRSRKNNDGGTRECPLMERRMYVGDVRRDPRVQGRSIKHVRKWITARRMTEISQEN